MSLELNVWRIDGGGFEVLTTSGLDKEERLEDLLNNDISIVSPDWMVIGRQVATDFRGFIDLLAVDSYGNLIILELKRNKTPRDVVAQLLDYASWVRNLNDVQIAKIFNDYKTRFRADLGDDSLDDVFVAKFDNLPDSWNENHELVIVASTLDHSSERIITYLSEEYEVPINTVFFQVFHNDGQEYLTRAWLRDPFEALEPGQPTGHRHEWNGEYYVSFGSGDDQRHWNDARRYGFISAGGGRWYSRGLSQLEVGDRLWVNTPGNGYVGVGRVVDTVKKVDEFFVESENGQVLLSDVPLVAKQMFADVDKPDFAEYVVKIEWLNTVPLDEAISETGFFGNQNIVARPTSPKWEYTISQLRKRFKITD